MTPADYAIVVILVISLLLGMSRGFMREALSLLGWLGGVWLAWRFAGSVKPFLGGLLADEPQRTWVARLIVLAVAVLVTWIIAEVLSYFIHQSGLSVSVDRWLGTLFGLLRGVVVVALLALAGSLVQLDEVRWWKKSLLIPYAVDVSHWISQFADTALDAESSRSK